jgi:hypothetical protein
MEKEIKIEAKEGVVKVYEGYLPDPINFKAQKITGTIDAPSEFFKKRHNKIGKNQVSSDSLNYNYDASYVEFDYVNNTIMLVVNAAHPGEIQVTGKFVENNIFSLLKINSTECYSTPNELLQMIRHKSNIFKSIEDHKQILNSLRNFTMNITREHKQWSDQRGNAGKSESFVLKEPHVLGFEINVPIFSGEPKSIIKVEVEIEIRNNNPEFFLVSPELPILMEEYKNKKFAELLEDFEDIAIIKK